MSSPVIDGGSAGTVYGPTGATAAAGPVFAPDLGTYTARTPYLTPAEFTEAGTGCDISQLVPGGTTGDQSAALARIIRQASAWADSLCYKVLAATVDTQAGRYLSRGGIISVPVKYAPLVAVTSISVGDEAWCAQPLGDLSRVGIEPPLLLRFAEPGCGWGAATRRRFVTVTYVNGWACTTLAAAATAGAASITLASNLAVGPGMTLTVDDGANTEQVTVASSFVPGSTGPVPLTAPLAAAHTVGVAASAIPPDIKRAVIALTACLIKTRGSEALIMGSIGSPPDKTALSEAGGIEDFEIATDLLGPYRRVR